MSQPQPFDFPRMQDLFRRLGVYPSRHKDQHFLHNPAQSERIADLCRLSGEHLALEIGAGLGNLTVQLAARAGSVIAVEKDESFRDWHEELEAHFANLRIHYGDFLRADLDSLLGHQNGPLVAVGNLPYNVTAPILFSLIDASIAWERIVVMVQLEVAERMVAPVAHRRASALTYKIALEYDARIEARLPPQEFLPPPRVHSAVVVLEPKTEPLVRSEEHKRRMYRLISGVFTHRRRTLANAMALGGIAPNRESAEGAVQRAGLDPKQRPETLGLEDYLRLDEALDSAK